MAELGIGCLPVKHLYKKMTGRQKVHMMRQHIILIGLLGLLSAPTPALAADWVSLGPDDEMEVFYDRGSITSNGDIRKIWMKYVSKQASPKAIQQSIDRVEFLCSARQMRTTSSTYYKADGAVEQSENTPDAPMADIIPDSTADNVLVLVCNAPASN
jgi:hypothetical protein